MSVDPFITAFLGGFSGILRWPQLDELWQALRSDDTAGWYIYAVGEAPPQAPASPSKLDEFIARIDQLLREEHDEDFCGIVYADNRQQPSFIKIYDPNNLGVVCGFSDGAPLPGWILSKLKPRDLPNAMPPTANRKRRWSRLFG